MAIHVMSSSIHVVCVLVCESHDLQWSLVRSWTEGSGKIDADPLDAAAQEQLPVDLSFRRPGRL